MNELCMIIKDMVKGGHRFSFDSAANILIPALDALSVVHSHHLVHRDIAPDNIFITDDRKVRLVDFGAAYYAGSDTGDTVTVILKHGFAPAEQYKAHPHLGPWTDIYGISATLYFMLTGKKPVNAIDRIPDDTLTLPSVWNEEITREQQAVILKGMAFRAENRYQSAAEMKDAIQRCLRKPELPELRIPERTEMDCPAAVGSHTGHPLLPLDIYASA